MQSPSSQQKSTRVIQNGPKLMAVEEGENEKRANVACEANPPPWLDENATDILSAAPESKNEQQNQEITDEEGVISQGESGPGTGMVVDVLSQAPARDESMHPAGS